MVSSVAYVPMSVSERRCRYWAAVKLYGRFIEVDILTVGQRNSRKNGSWKNVAAKQRYYFGHMIRKSSCQNAGYTTHGRPRMNWTEVSGGRRMKKDIVSHCTMQPTLESRTWLRTELDRIFTLGSLLTFNFTIGEAANSLACWSKIPVRYAVA